LGRATARVVCPFCSHEYFVSKYDLKKFSLPWQDFRVSLCPSCDSLNIVHSQQAENVDDLLFEYKYDKQLLEFVTVAKSKDTKKISEIINQIENDKVLEKYIQIYVKENPAMFELENMTGPFPDGPDLKGTWKGNKVEIEVERAYTNYKQHNHHNNLAFRNVSILICLDHREPIKKSMDGLPPHIWYINHQHFLEWYANYLVDTAHFKSVQSLSMIVTEWFETRLIEEENGFESYTELPLEEYDIDIAGISKAMAYKFLKPYFERIDSPDFYCSEIEAEKLLAFYTDQREKYLEAF
jgi:hypothetical protein